jgi:hypothetical protein
MNTVLAALDSSAADRPVIETTLGVADLVGASVRAVQVGDGPALNAKGVASMAGVPSAPSRWTGGEGVAGGARRGGCRRRCGRGARVSSRAPTPAHYPASRTRTPAVPRCGTSAFVGRKRVDSP